MTYQEMYRAAYDALKARIRRIEMYSDCSRHTLNGYLQDIVDRHRFDDTVESIAIVNAAYDIMRNKYEDDGIDIDKRI